MSMPPFDRSFRETVCPMCGLSTGLTIITNRLDRAHRLVLFAECACGWSDMHSYDSCTAWDNDRVERKVDMYDKAYRATAAARAKRLAEKQRDDRLDPGGSDDAA